MQKENKLLTELEKMKEQEKDDIQGEIPKYQRIKKRELKGQDLQIDSMGNPFMVKGLDDLPNLVRSVYVTDLEHGDKFTFLINVGSALDREDFCGMKHVTIGEQDTGKQNPMDVWVPYRK